MIKLKFNIVIVSILITVFSGCNSGTSSFQLSITNPVSIDRKDALVVLTRDLLQKKIGTIASGKFVSVKDPGGKDIVVQFDDMDGDGNWDEAVFLCSLKASEEAKFTIEVSGKGTLKAATAMAHVRQKKKLAGRGFGPVITEDTMPDKNPPTDFSVTPLPPYLTEGPSWENDKVAFRQYFDTRNGKDIFGKIVPGMVMDTIGINVNNSYHQLSNWGMDILHVGNSLGAGAIAFKLKENGKDTLIRLGGNSIKNETYKEIADGPVRAIFKIKYEWTLAGKPVQVIDETSIWGGQYFYQTKVSIKNAPSNIKLVTGIPDFYDNKSDHLTLDSAAILYSYGRQSENHDELGMAILIPKENFVSVGETPKENQTGAVVYKSEIFDTHYISQIISNGTAGVYRFYSGWEKTDKNFTSLDYFKNFLKEQATFFSNPIRIKW